MLLIKNGLVHDAVNREPYRADILIENGKIARIAPEIAAEGAEIYDAEGMNVYPGFVEAHGHTGLDGYGIGYEGADYNEMGDIMSPQLRAIDAIEPRDYALQEAREAGVTTLCVGPGSANVLGGTFAAIKPVGVRVDKMCIRPEVAMKCAFGENPKRCYRDKGNLQPHDDRRAACARMLFKAREYMRKIDRANGDPEKMPPFDMKLNAMLPVVRGEMPLKAHAHQADDIFTALRIAHEFGVKITLEHVTEGHLIVDELKAENVMLAVGPSLGHATQVRAAQQELDHAGRSRKGGLPRFDYHRLAGDPAEIPAAVRGSCGEGGHG